MFSFLFGKYLGKVLGCVVNLCLTFKETDKLLQIGHKFPDSNAPGLQFLQILANTCYGLSFFVIATVVGVKRFLSFSSAKFLKPL